MSASLARPLPLSSDAFGIVFHARQTCRESIGETPASTTRPMSRASTQRIETRYAEYRETCVGPGTVSSVSTGKARYLLSCALLAQRIPVAQEPAHRSATTSRCRPAERLAIRAPPTESWLDATPFIILAGPFANLCVSIAIFFFLAPVLAPFGSLPHVGGLSRTQSVL